MGVYGYIDGVYYDGGGWRPEAGFDPTQRPWYIGASENSGKVTLIGPYSDVQSGKVIISLSIMLKDRKSVISMDIYLDRIQEIAEDAVASGASDYEVILDRSGTVIAHSVRSEIGKNYAVAQGTMADAVLEHLGEAGGHYFEYDYDRSHYIVYHSQVQNSWHCLSIINATNVFRPLKLILSCTLLVVAVVVFVLSMFMDSYNKSTRRIKNLTEETRLDKLTGFLNKASAGATMAELCQHASGLLAILDLDSFKLVNDLFGHDMGDRVLSAFADVIRRSTEADDTLCRIGGDEFLIFCRGMAESELAPLTQRLNDELISECTRLMGSGFDIPIGVSVGAAAVPEQGRDYRQLFPLADKALYHVKQNGKHACALYAPALHADAADEETPVGRLAHITQILEERGETDAALWLGQDAFTPVYRYALRAIRHRGGSVCELLFLLRAEDAGNAVPADMSERFASVLGEALCARDIVLQNGPTQFFVLLPDCRQAEDAAQRVLELWRRTAESNRFSVTYVAQERDFGAADAETTE